MATVTERERSTAYTTLKLNHAKSLHDISELRKLRESVGQNIKQACSLVDGHERDLFQHCENLRKTRENFSGFERKLSDAALRIENGSRSRRRTLDESYQSYSSGDESTLFIPARPSASRIRDPKQRYSLSLSSDTQSLSSACSFSSSELRKNKWKQIAVPIYEDSIDSGLSSMSTQNVSPGPQNTTISGGFSERTSSISEEETKRKFSDSNRQRKIRGGSLAYESDASSVSYTRNRSNTSSSMTKQRPPGDHPLHPFILSHTWRSTPNIFDDGGITRERRERRIRRGSGIDAYATDPSYSTDQSCTTKSQSSASHISAMSCSSVSAPKKANRSSTAAKSHEWRSLPELSNQNEENKKADGKMKREKKRKGFIHFLRRITKSGEYVVKDDIAGGKRKKAKPKNKNLILTDRIISCPAGGAPIGKTVDIVEGKRPLHRVEIIQPPNGLYGFYVQRGFRKHKKGIFIGSFVNDNIKKLFTGVLREGDEIIELNSSAIDVLTLKDILNTLSEAKKLDMLILPFCNR